MPNDLDLHLLEAVLQSKTSFCFKHNKSTRLFTSAGGYVVDTLIFFNSVSLFLTN